MSNKLSTKDIKTTTEGGSGEPKTLGPGNVQCTIHDVEIRDFPYKPDALEIILHLEGPAIEGFQGFRIDKDDESKGHYAGKVGRVRATEWAFADGTTKSGVEISRDRDILKFMKNFCDALGIPTWLEQQDNKHETIHSLIEAFRMDKPFAGKKLHFCLAAKEYVNRNGYTQYDLFLPKFHKNGAPFSTDLSKVLVYNEEQHLRKKKVNPVSEFGNEGGGLSAEASTDFQLDE